MPSSSDSIYWNTVIRDNIIYCSNPKDKIHLEDEHQGKKKVDLCRRSLAPAVVARTEVGEKHESKP